MSADPGSGPGRDLFQTEVKLIQQQLFIPPIDGNVCTDDSYLLNRDVSTVRDNIC